MQLYEASKLYNIYSGNKWKYDRVEAPLTPFPTIIAEWSGEQFRYRIKELTDSSLLVLKPYFNKSISDFKEIIKVDKGSEAFYPYLSDFLYSQACELVDETYADDALRQSREGSPAWAMWETREDCGYDRLLKLYEKYPQGLAGAYLLYQLVGNSKYDIWDIQKAGELKMLEAYLKDNSINEMTSALESLVREIRRPRIHLGTPASLAPGQQFDVVCDYGFTGTIGFKIYRNETPTADYRHRRLKLVETVKRPVDKSTGWDTDSLAAKIATPGNYIIQPVCDGANDMNGNEIQLTVTPWMPALVSLGNNYAAIVTDFTTGTPCAGISIQARGDYRSPSFTAIGSTGPDGILQVRPTDVLNKGGNHPIQLGNAKGDKVYFGYDAVFETYHKNEPRKWSTGGIFLSRPAYHPGDSVEWSFVAVEKDPAKGTSTLLSGKEFKVIIRDANYQPVDTVSVTTDRFGRGYGSFSIPTDRLTGLWSIRVMADRIIDSSTFVVSDFKVPVFEVIDLKVDKADGDYIITGRAQRYSGASVPGADVKLNITTSWKWYFGERDRIDLDLQGTTDDSGFFSIKVPADTLSAGAYQCKVIVTSISSDIAEASCFFRAGKPLQLTAVSEGPLNLNSDKAAYISFQALDNDLKPCRTDARWQLLSGKDIVAQGDCVIDTVKTRFNWQDVPVGHYKLNILPTDSAMFEAKEVAEIWLYSISRNKVPEGMVVMTPKSTLKDVKGNTVDITVGVEQDQTIYTITQTDDNRVNAKALHLPAGFSKVSVDLNDEESQQVMLLAVRRGKVRVAYVTVKRPKPDNQLTLHGESFRDKLVPGAPEQWHLRLDTAKGQGAAAALVATMYNGALDALASLSAPSDLQSLLSPARVRQSMRSSWPRFGNQELSWIKLFKDGKYFNVTAPSFLYSDVMAYAKYKEYKSTMLTSNLRIRGTNMAMAAMADGGVEESAEMEMEVAAEAPAAGNTSSEDYQSFEYRDTETLQAFWMPALTIDDQGDATINFTVPNAVGQWQFRAFSWSDDCRAATMRASLQASKPIMAQANLPRFMRQGDRIRILSTVMNTTDETQDVEIAIEIFDPATDEILASNTERMSIPAKGQRLAGIDFEAKVGMSTIGYRVKASNGTFSDGEQAVIPVLESSTIAIDSELFYLNEENPVFSTTLPAARNKQGIVALQYCQNPVWDLVRTLPGLYDQEPRTATAAASSAYAAFIAKGLLERYPEIKEVLRIWKSQPQDSSLVSKLYKNEDLKLALLAQTPFVGAANANTEQMERLALTFDEPTIGNVINVAVAKLARLQSADGGFLWGSWTRQSSIWITREVLMTFGMLNELGFKADNDKLNRIIDKAFGYVDSTLKDKDDFEYAYVYSLYPDRKPSVLKGRQAIDKCCQDLIKDWKKESTAQKASTALMLHNFKYTAVAKEIMTSVGQFATTNRLKGTTFNSVRSVDDYSTLLRAFSKIEPGNKIVDGIRQWIVLQTQANDDLGAWNPTSLIASTLTNGTRWISIPTDETAAVTVDGKPLGISETEAATGAFSIRLEPSSKKREIKIERAGGAPVSYGSILSIATIPMKEVKARPTEGMSIGKRFLVERNGQWVETTQFQMGERVKVQLLVNADRNMEYVTINDQRPAALEPVEQTSGWVWSGSLGAYRENGNELTRLFINYLPKGTFYLTYETTAAFTGSFSSGTATLQSQYAPELTCRSGACIVDVK